MKGFFKAVFRGLIKSLPLGNVATEVIENIQNKNAVITEEKPLTQHNWVSIGTQFIIVCVILYSFVTNKISLNDLVSLLHIVNI